MNARFVGVSGDNSPITKLVSPMLDLSAKAPSYVLKFWYAQPNWSGDQNETKVYYRTSPSSNWVQLAHYTADASVWTEEPGLVLPNLSETYQIAIEGINNYGYANAVDNVTIEAAAVDPTFAVTPTSKDFLTQQIGTTSAAQVFTLKNTGGGELFVNSVSLTGTNASDFTLTDANSYPVALGAGESVTVSVVFNPATLGAKTASLSISHDLDAEPVIVQLSGEGTDSTIREIPYIQTWDVTALLDGWITYNVNADAYTWGLTLDGASNAAYIRYNSASAMNDWLISPPIQLEGGQTYDVTYRYRAAGATYPENMKVAFGTAQEPTAMTEVIATHAGFVNTNYTNGSCQFTPATTGNYYLGFHGYSAADMYNIYLDDIRILLPNTNIAQVTATGATASVTVPAIVIDETPVSPQVGFAGLADNPVIHVSAAYNPPDAPSNAGLVLSIDAGNLGGVTITVTHGLGFTPLQMGYKIGEGGYVLVNNPGDWTDTVVTFTVPNSKGPQTLKFAFPKGRDTTLPVTLSEFSAVLTADMFVQIAWTTQTEVNHAGYYVLRGDTDVLADAIQLTSSLITDGTATGTEVRYIYADHEVYNGANYYYWLQSMDLTGMSMFFGPLVVSINGNPGDPETPGIPVVTELKGNFPNPFNPSTTIRYSLAEAGSAKIEIYNLRGQILRTFNLNHANPGVYSLNWDGRDARGQALGSGMYLYRMTSGTYSSTRKMILNK